MLTTSAPGSLASIWRASCPGSPLAASNPTRPAAVFTRTFSPATADPQTATPAESGPRSESAPSMASSRPPTAQGAPAFPR